MGVSRKGGTTGAEGGRERERERERETEEKILEMDRAS